MLKAQKNEDRTAAQHDEAAVDDYLGASALAVNATGGDDILLAAEVSRRARDTLPLYQQVALVPWIGWTERASRDYDIVTDSDRQSDQNVLRLLREHLLQLQVNPQSGTPGLDTGGFMLQPGTRGVTAQSLRPGIFLTSMIDDPVFSDPDRRDIHLAAQQSFMRYLLQLQCRQDVAGTWRNPERTLGGIRAATWDSRLHPTAQALGLIVLSGNTGK